MPIRYTTTLDAVRPEHLRGFFEGWPNPPSQAAHLRMLAGSSVVVLASSEQSGEVVGFINAVTDGDCFAFIPLLEVLSAYRKRGIGSELVRRMLVELRDYYAIDLCCDEELRSFYERLGFTGTVGMSIRNRANL